MSLIIFLFFVRFLFVYVLFFTNIFFYFLAACTTVLVPDRVAQALNLKLEGGVVGGYQQHQARFNGENGKYLYIIYWFIIDYLYLFIDLFQ